jgi:molybdate transport system ATP-binding protein
MLERFPRVDGPGRINAFELAAIVFDEGVSIDHLMCFFAEELRREGRAVSGILRLPSDDEAPAAVTYAGLGGGARWTVMRGEVAPFSEMTRALKQAVTGRADLAVVPRFSPADPDGGFADAFGTLAAFGVPILTAVRRDDVEAWLRFTGGIGTLIACRLRIVRGWWEETDARRQKARARRRTEASREPGAEVVPLVPGYG